MVALVYGTGQMVRTGRRGMSLAQTRSWRAERFCNGLELGFRFCKDENSGRNGVVDNARHSISSPIDPVMRCVMRTMLWLSLAAILILPVAAPAAPPTPVQGPTQAPSKQVQAPAQAPAKATQAPAQAPAKTAQADTGYRTYSYEPGYRTYSYQPSMGSPD